MSRRLSDFLTANYMLMSMITAAFHAKELVNDLLGFGGKTSGLFM